MVKTFYKEENNLVIKEKYSIHEQMYLKVAMKFGKQTM